MCVFYIKVLICYVIQYSTKPISFLRDDPYCVGFDRELLSSYDSGAGQNQRNYQHRVT